MTHITGLGRNKNIRDHNIMLRWVETAMKLKKVMQKKNLRIARCVCPHCDSGRITGTLNGRKDHLHARCSNSFCLTVIE